MDSKKRDTNIGVVAGIGFGIAGRVLDGNGNPVGLALLVVAVGFFVFAAKSYAEGKGHSGWWGVLGVFGLLGFIVLLFLRDRYKDGGEIDGWPEDQSSRIVRPY